MYLIDYTLILTSEILKLFNFSFYISCKEAKKANLSIKLSFTFRCQNHTLILGFIFGSDKSPRRGDLVCDIMLKRALKEFLKHSKESKGGSKTRK